MLKQLRELPLSAPWETLFTLRKIRSERPTSASWAVKHLQNSYQAGSRPSSLHVPPARTVMTDTCLSSSVSGDLSRHRLCVCVTVEPLSVCLNEAMFKSEAQRERGVKWELDVEQLLNGAVQRDQGVHGALVSRVRDNVIRQLSLATI